jgi:hypothetical protein
MQLMQELDKVLHLHVYNFSLLLDDGSFINMSRNT